MICDSKTNLHKDHIWPIAKGGTDNKVNIQVLCGKHNLSKSDSIHISNIKDLKDGMICKRYYSILNKAKNENWTISRFELEISKAVRDLIIFKSKLNDTKLAEFFVKEKDRNNRKHSIERAVKKFREYCSIVKF